MRLGITYTLLLFSATLAEPPAHRRSDFCLLGAYPSDEKALAVTART
jgi:hypothetical protein